MKPFFLALIITLVLVSFQAGAESLSTGGPYTIGETLSIQGETNFNTDNKVLVEVYPSSFGPTSKFDPSMTGGGSIVVPVVKSGSGVYSWTANISSANWKPDQYMVRVEVIGKDHRETALVTLTEIQSSGRNLSLPDQRESNVSTSEPLKTPEQTIIPKNNPIETSTPKPTQTRQSPLSVGFIVCSLVAARILTGKRRG